MVEKSKNNNPLPSQGGMGIFEPLLIRQPIIDGRTEDVRELLIEWVESSSKDKRVLPLSNVGVTTIFYDNSGSSDALIWYIETVESSEWEDADRIIRSESPLFEAGLDQLLEDEVTVKANGVNGGRLVVYGTHPNRQEEYEEVVDSNVIAPVNGEELPIPIALTTVPLRKGWTSRITARVVDFTSWIKDFDYVHSMLRDETETIENEGMFTESFIMEPDDERQVMHYYMETEDMNKLYEEYDNADSLTSKASDRIMRTIFEDPSEFLDPPLETDYEVLIHSVNADRP